MKDLFLLSLFSNALAKKLYGLEIGSTGRVETEYATGNKNRFIVRISGHCQLRNGEYYQVKNVTGTWISDQHVITGRLNVYKITVKMYFQDETPSPPLILKPLATGPFSERAEACP